MPGMADRGGSVKRMRENGETEGRKENRDRPEDSLCIAICDDDLPAAWELACIIEKILGEWEERAEIRIFTNGPDLLSQASEDQIVFLDVDMPGMDGMEVGRKLREMGIDCPIIIETGMVERFKEAFAIGALRYVTKAFSEDEIREALACLVKDRIGWRKIRVYDKRISLNLRQRDIDRIHAYNSYVLLEAKGHTFRREESLASLERELDGRLFVRISRSEIVNMSKVTELDLKRDRIYIGEKECLVSKRCRKDFEEKMMRFDLYDRRKVR